MLDPRPQIRHLKAVKRPEQQMDPMVCRPLAHRLFDKPVRLNSLHHACRVRMEPTARLVHHSRGLTKHQAGRLLPGTYSDSPKLRTSSKTNLGLIRTRGVCLHQMPTTLLLLGLLCSKTISNLLRISLFDQHPQKHIKHLFSLVLSCQHKEQQPLQRTLSLQMVDQL
jgi:hypothetical protein